MTVRSVGRASLRAKRSNPSGFTLFSVLLIMQICMLLTIYELASVIYSAKANADAIQMNHLMHIADNALNDAEQQISDDPEKCKIPIMPSLSLSKLPRSWWATHACIGNSQEMQYYYVAESLGVDHCALMSPRFDRVSVLIIDNRLKVRVMLQSIMATNTGQKPICDIKLHTVQNGRQRWRKWIGREEDDS